LKIISRNFGNEFSFSAAYKFWFILEKLHSVNININLE
jgi:hypothetical protein